MDASLLVGGVGAVVALVGIGLLQTILGLAGSDASAPPAATRSWLDDREAMRFMVGARRLVTIAGVGMALQLVALLWYVVG